MGKFIIQKTSQSTIIYSVDDAETTDEATLKVQSGTAEIIQGPSSTVTFKVVPEKDAKNMLSQNRPARPVAPEKRPGVRTPQFNTNRSGNP